MLFLGLKYAFNRERRVELKLIDTTYWKQVYKNDNIV